MNEAQDARRRHAKKRLAVVLLGGVAGVAIGLAVVYGIVMLARNAAVEPTRNAAVEPICVPALETARAIAPFAKGEVAALVVAKAPKQLPELAFRDAAGEPKKLSDWRGRTVLLNLWATWCPPCRKEMPALDELQAKLGGANFEVVSINIDIRDREKPKTWLKEVGINRLAYYADNSAKVFQDLKEVGKALGMPTTLLVNPQGCEIAALSGPAEWASDDAIKLVSAALKN